MKKAISVMGWIFVSLTIFALVCTLLTTYQYIHEIKYFSTYRTLQICMICTMIVWAIKMFDNSDRSRSLLYSIFCTLIAVGTMFFMYMGVF